MMRTTPAEDTLIIRALGNRQRVCSGLAWESQVIGRLEHAQQMRDEQVACAQLISRLQAAQAAPKVDAAQAAHERKTE